MLLAFGAGPTAPSVDDDDVVPPVAPAEFDDIAGQCRSAIGLFGAVFTQLPVDGSTMRS